MRCDATIVAFGPPRTCCVIVACGSKVRRGVETWAASLSVGWSQSLHGGGGGLGGKGGDGGLGGVAGGSSGDGGGGDGVWVHVSAGRPHPQSIRRKLASSLVQDAHSEKPAPHQNVLLRVPHQTALLRDPHTWFAPSSQPAHPVSPLLMTGFALTSVGMKPESTLPDNRSPTL